MTQTLVEYRQICCYVLVHDDVVVFDRHWVYACVEHCYCFIVRVQIDVVRVVGEVDAPTTTDAC
jgi:hypothetical protein